MNYEELLRNLVVVLAEKMEPKEIHTLAAKAWERYYGEEAYAHDDQWEELFWLVGAALDNLPGD